MLLDPCADHAGISGKVRHHLATLGKDAVNKLFMGALRDDAAVIDNGDAITKPLCLFHIMRGIDDRGSLVA